MVPGRRFTKINRVCGIGRTEAVGGTGIIYTSKRRNTCKGPPKNTIAYIHLSTFENQRGGALLKPTKIQTQKNSLLVISSRNPDARHYCSFFSHHFDTGKERRSVVLSFLSSALGILVYTPFLSLVVTPFVNWPV